MMLLQPRTPVFFSNTFYSPQQARSSSSLLYVGLSYSSIVEIGVRESPIQASFGLAIPAFLAFVFMVGKNSLYLPNGVLKTNKRGCCTQALIFPGDQVPELKTYLRDMQSWQTDTMINNYSDE